jgi:hypothetical protein
VYNASNNELVRTKTLVKNAIVVIDATPFRQWYESHYALPLGRKKGAKLVSVHLHHLMRACGCVERVCAQTRMVNVQWLIFCTVLHNSIRHTYLKSSEFIFTYSFFMAFSFPLSYALFHTFISEHTASP